MNVVRHQDEGVELIARLRAIVVQDAQQKLRVCVSLKDAAAIRRDAGDEEGANLLGRKSGHAVTVARPLRKRKITKVRNQLRTPINSSRMPSFPTRDLHLFLAQRGRR